MAKTKIKKSWYKRWWAITLFIFIGLIILGSLLPDSSNNSVQPTQEKTTTLPEKISLDELRAKIEYSGISADEELTSLTENNGVYEIKYKFNSVEFNSQKYNKIIDEGGLELNVFRIMETFLENPDYLSNLERIRIEATTTTPKKTGIVSQATVTKEQIQKYGIDPFSINLKDFGFTFDESFY